MNPSILNIVFDIDGPLCWDPGRVQKFFAYMAHHGEDCCHRTLLETGLWPAAITDYQRSRIHALWLAFSGTVDGEAKKPTPGAPAAMRQLLGHRRHLATARSQKEKEQTLQWLRRYYAPFDEAHFELDDKGVAVAADVFIEDTPGIARQVAEASEHTLVILFPAVGSQNIVVDHPRIRHLQAASLLSANNCPVQHAKMCEEAWLEIVHIIEYEFERVYATI